MRRWLERTLTVVLLAACGETLPPAGTDPSPDGGGGPDASADLTPPSDGGALDGTLDVFIPPSCAADAAVVPGTGCAAPHQNAQTELTHCAMFDDAAPNVTEESNGTGRSSNNDFVSPPNSVFVNVVPDGGFGRVFISGEVANVPEYGKAVLEADVKLGVLGARFVIATFVATDQAGSHTFQLVVEPTGALVVTSTQPGKPQERASASPAGVILCPGRWTHLKMRFAFTAPTVGVGVDLDDKITGNTFASTLAPDDGGGSVVGYVGVFIEDGGVAASLSVDNMQLYVH